MDEYYFKRSGQIPTFGDWDTTNDLPITQYFECARQAGLLRYSSASGDIGSQAPSYIHGGPDLYSVDFKKHSRPHVRPRKTRVREREQRKQGRVCDETEPPPTRVYENCRRKQQRNDTASGGRLQRVNVRPPKPVDEDLYKIPPELLNSSKPRKMPGFFSCLVPACGS